MNVGEGHRRSNMTVRCTSSCQRWVTTATMSSSSANINVPPSAAIAHRRRAGGTNGGAMAPGMDRQIRRPRPGPLRQGRGKHSRKHFEAGGTIRVDSDVTSSTFDDEGW